MNLKKKYIKAINKINLNKLTVIFVTFLLIIVGFIVVLPKINSLESFSIAWEVSMDLNSPDGSDDTVFFGEALDANDGPPADSYDVPHPPVPPQPYIYAWFDDGLASPYEKLRKDYREYPDIDKIWNLTVMWFDITDSTTITITWSNSEVAGSEYDSVLLYKDGSQIKDMLTQNSYSYTASPMDIQTFQIICHKSSNSIPNTPSNPDPYDGETNVDVNADLNWDGGDPDGDPVTYDIYFDTTSPPTKVSSNQSSTSYDPGTMNYDEIYYWKIVAWDSHDASSEGTEWDFTTEEEANNPPNTPNNPDPYDSETNVDVNADLNWDGGDPDGDPVTYDIYFDTTSPPTKVSSNQSSTSYDPGIMNYNETYYWKIVAWDYKDASTSGQTWSFTTNIKQESLAGDMNGNGILNANDCRYLAKHIGGDPLYSILYADGDVNSNGRINANDCRYLAKHIGGDPAYDPLYPTV